MKKLIHTPDYTLIILIFLIILFGLVMLSSASSVLGYEKKIGDSYWYIKHQLMMGFLPGLFLFFILSRIDFRIWKKFSPFLLFISVGLLILVFVPGIGASYGKARSWINIFGYSLQPSEIVKLTFLLYLAAWLEKRKERVHTVAYGLLPFIIYLGLILFLIILQPDMGTMFIILITSIAVYFIAGAKIKHLILIFGGCLAGFVALIKLASYSMDRFTTFLNPGADPQGIGYQINQALLAVGSGGWFGLGLGHSKQKFQYLPEVQGDSIFAIMAEELGFILITGFIIVFLLLFYRMIKVARNSPDFFGQLTVIGIASWLIGQFFVNVGAMLGLVPLTGLPLPLVSYGGTALMTSMAALGIVVNISKFTQQRRVVDGTRMKKK
ncbi:MAG: putative lipid II flippase FtsW [Candidatus Kuenenbacteria bacterium]